MDLSTAPDIKEFCLDISDLLVYTMHHRHVSGIQRTQANLAFSILGRGCRANGAEIIFVNYDHASGRVDRLASELLKQYMLVLRDVESSHETVKACIADMITQASPWQGGRHSAYVVTGAFWMFANAPILYNDLKRLGCVVGCLIYDLIPISHPEFCDATLVSTFKTSIDSGLPFFDLILTISEYTAQQVLQYIADNDGRSTIVVPVPLAHSIHDEPASDEQPYPELQSATFNDYILCVGTIEARKNHAYLFQVWKLLLESGVENVPKLVIVGRWGWRVADLKSQLEACHNLGGYIVILSEVDDEVLEVLYKKSLFTVMSSFVEGWGLPVGESLAHGKFCIASNTSSIPEVGGDFVEYIDPYNARQGFEKISEMILNRDIVARRERAIKNSFRQRTWEQVADDFTKAIRTAIMHQDFVRGESFEFSVALGMSVEAGYAGRGYSASMSSHTTPFQFGWHDTENFGRWMNGRQGRIRFRTVETAQADITLSLELVSVPWIRHGLLKISLGGSDYDHPVPKGERFIIRHQLSSGIVDCSLSFVGEIDSSVDPRGLSVGIERFSVT